MTYTNIAIIIGIVVMVLMVIDFLKGWYHKWKRRRLFKHRWDNFKY